MASLSRNVLLVALLALVLFTTQTHAFGAGNIASISAIEGKNWRHGDIEDLLKQVACIKHHKWTSLMIKRVYFGNWLRDYSQAMDTGALKKANAETIRILVWLLSFLGFGYATGEFEVTSERLGVYRPEEHIDNPKNYNDDEDARKYEPRLRGLVRQIELDIDPETGMKNYIANGKGDWATSAAFVKYSFERSIQYGRKYTQGSNFLSKGSDDDLAEALRCLGQGLHTLEDFGAHTNYVELALIEMGHRNVFPLVGTQTGINLRGKHVFPLVTGTFGMVDFYHSVLGEATDHFTQSEVNEMDNALGIAQQSASSSNPLGTLIKLLSKMPGTRDLCVEAEQLQESSMAQARSNAARGDVGGLSRGVSDYDGSTRSGPGDYSAPHGGFQDYSHSSNQQSYQQSYDYSQTPQQSWSQQSYDYSQQQSWQQQPQQSSYGQPHGQSYDNSYQQQPPHQQWSSGPDQQSYSGQPHHQQDFGQPTQPQWNQPQDHQSYHAQQPAHDQYNQQQNPQSYSTQQPSHDQTNPPQVQPQHTPAAPTDSSAPAQTSSAQPVGLPGVPNFDPAKTIKQIYPILAFRDKVVRTISSIIEKIPGLEALVDRIVETLTVFVLSLLAPFVRPVLEGLSKSLQKGSAGVIDSSGKHQYEIWTDPRSSDPTHSMLSKDHFSNILNDPAGHVAGEILKFIAPRVLYAWEHPDVPVQKVMEDVETIFHHPAIRNEHLEVHRNMFNAVKQWKQSLPSSGRDLDTILSIDSVRAGKNHKAGVNNHLPHTNTMPHTQSGSHSTSNTQGGLGGLYHQVEGLVGGQHQSSSHQSQQGGIGGMFNQAENLYNTFSGHGSGHNRPSGSHGGAGGGGLNDMLSLADKLPIPGVHNLTSSINKFSSFIPGGGTREINTDDGPRGRSIESGNENSDIDVDSSYAIFGGSNVGGARELRDAMNRGNQRDRSPSPMPLQAPSGYEQYAGSGQQSFSGGEDQRYSQAGYGNQPHGQQQYEGGYQGSSDDYYQGAGRGGGTSDSYYRS